MLARASSDAGARVRRSKSTSSVHKLPPHPESFDPDLARQQAIAAATAAFVRAQVNDAAEQKKRSSEVSRSKSNASRKSLISQGQGSHFPPRDSSFRSMQPQQTTSTRRQSRASTLTTVCDMNSAPTSGLKNSREASAAPPAEKFPPFYPTPSNAKPMPAPRPLSAQPSVTFSENSRPNSQPKSRLSTASSITSQQIRKARSMYYASSVQTGSPISRPPAKYLTTPPSVTVSPITEPTALSPPVRNLGPSPLAGPRIPVAVDATSSEIDHARDKYLQNFQQRSIKHKPSLFLAPFKKRRGDDRDTRVGSVASEHTLKVSPPQPELQVAKEKRSFSGSLRSKIKKVFRRTSNNAPVSMPVQQIQASREYFGTSSGLHGSDVPSPDEKMVRRVQSRSSSNGSVRSNHSNRSLHSEANAASRVTSWGTSSTGDTATQRAMKRLTVIHEAKDSIGSETDRIASMSTKRKSLPPGALSAFRDPMESLLEESSIDPKRVFSALMKEMDTSKDRVYLEPHLSPAQSIGTPSSTHGVSGAVERTPGAESDVFESSKTKSLHSSGRDHRPPSAAAQSAQSKASSIRTLGRAIRSTIRTVTPAEQPSSPLSADTAPGNGDQGLHTILPDQPRSTQAFVPSPSQIERRVERAKDRWKTSLDDVEQLQFPRETDRTYNVTNFAQQRSAYETSDGLIEAVKVVRTGDLHLDTSYVPPASPVPRDPPQMPMSPSVYSRNTDGVSILPNDSVMSFDGPDDRLHSGGSAVILTSQSIRSYVVGTPSPDRPASLRTSRDWKAWLSQEVSNIECTSQEDITILGDRSRNIFGGNLTSTEGSKISADDFSLHDISRSPSAECEDTTVILRISEHAEENQDLGAVDTRRHASQNLSKENIPPLVLALRPRYPPQAPSTVSATSTPSRARIRATVRPISPEKLSRRRPKSAFDLRGTTTPRPISELRRPALHIKTSSSSLALNKEPSPGTEDRVIDSILDENGGRSGSVTPGQRMADRFLEERKSLETKRSRGGLRLVREDTPAFL